MKKTVIGVSLGLMMAATTASVGAQVSDSAHWPQWRGPFFNGMARGDAPTQWSDTSNIKWKVEVPGRGHSIFDHEEGSFIVALDKRTGKELWRTPRDERSSWSTPMAVEHAGRKQIIVTGTTKVRSYDPDSGKVLWEAAGLGSNPIPVPVNQNGVVYVMSGHRDPRLMAIKQLSATKPPIAKQSTTLR